jgi:hypothetical protein
MLFTSKMGASLCLLYALLIAIEAASLTTRHHVQVPDVQFPMTEHQHLHLVLAAHIALRERVSPQYLSGKPISEL